MPSAVERLRGDLSIIPHVASVARAPSPAFVQLICWIKIVFTRHRRDSVLAETILR
jgi:hypothetical protein